MLRRRLWRPGLCRSGLCRSCSDLRRPGCPDLRFRAELRRRSFVRLRADLLREQLLQEAALPQAPLLQAALQEGPLLQAGLLRSPGLLQRRPDLRLRLLV